MDFDDIETMGLVAAIRRSPEILNEVRGKIRLADAPALDLERWVLQEFREFFDSDSPQPLWRKVLVRAVGSVWRVDWHRAASLLLDREDGL